MHKKRVLPKMVALILICEVRIKDEEPESKEKKWGYRPGGHRTASPKKKPVLRGYPNGRRREEKANGGPACTYSRPKRPLGRKEGEIKQSTP